MTPSPNKPVCRYETPFAQLGVDVVQEVLSLVAGESIGHVLSTNGFRRVLPFSIACKWHYDVLRDTVRGLSLLPLRHKICVQYVYRVPRVRLCAGSSKVPEYPRSLLPLLPASQQLCKSPTLLDEYLPRAVANFPKLCTLHFFRNSEINDKTLQSIVSLAPNLCELRLRNSHTLSVKGISSLTRCKMLCLLDLSFCCNLSDECGPFLARLPKLETLLVCRWPISDAFLKSVCENRSLRYLGLSGCLQLTSAAFEAIATQGRLRGLQVRWSRSRGDEMYHSLSLCKSLENLDMGSCRSLTDITVQNTLNPKNFPNLRILSLSNCTQLSDAGMRFVSLHGGLRKLDVSFCNRLTDNGVRVLSELAWLEDLKLCGCLLVTDEGVGSLSKMCSLRCVDLSRCSGLTDRAVELLGMAAGRPFTWVGLAKCFRISMKAMDCLEMSGACRVLLRHTFAEVKVLS